MVSKLELEIIGFYVMLITIHTELLSESQVTGVKSTKDSKQILNTPQPQNLPLLPSNQTIPSIPHKIHPANLFKRIIHKFIILRILVSQKCALHSFLSLYSHRMNISHERSFTTCPHCQNCVQVLFSYVLTSFYANVIRQL